jgi:hypothetical protein
MLESIFGNFPRIFGIFRIFYVAFRNYLAISRLFLSRKYSLEIKKKKKKKLFPFFISFSLFGPWLLSAQQTKSVAAPLTPYRSSVLAGRSPVRSGPTTPTRGQRPSTAIAAQHGPLRLPPPRTLTGGPPLSSLTLRRAGVGLWESRLHTPAPPPRRGPHANRCARPCFKPPPPSLGRPEP